MSQLEIDKRTLEDIIEQMKTKASTYTPEWRFDLENKDAGSALAVIYAEMMKNTVSRYNSMQEKNKIAFYNKIGTDINSATSAGGFVTFNLINDEVEGSKVEKNTQIFADVKGDERVVFETLDDLYATNSKPVKMYMVNREKDYIANIYDEEIDKEKNKKNSCDIKLFDYKKENIQEHVFYFTHPSVFNIKTNGEIIIDLKICRDEKLDNAVKKTLMNNEIVKFEYLSEQGYVEFSKVKFEGEKIVLFKNDSMPQFKFIQEENSDGIIDYNVIRCKANDISLLEKIQIDRFFVRSRGKMLSPELIIADGNEYKTTKFYGFGERPTLMQELYFVSEEVLSKKGAYVHLNFDLEYGKFEIENNIPDPNYSWKNIMKKSDFVVDPEYDITISEVVWEYYNGTGWTRLFPEEMYTDIFNAETDNFKNITINFQCPEDIEPFLVNSVTSYSIRAKVLKMNNLFKMKGYYISPCISRVKFKYEYVNNKIPPYSLVLNNNLEEIRYEGLTFANSTNAIQLFREIKDENPSVYIGFNKPFINGPLKMMYILENSNINSMPVVAYQYLKDEKWNNINMLDGTDNFKKSGIITMMGDIEFAPRKIFGEELYWIKIEDINNKYKTAKVSKPVIKGLHMNTTVAVAIETMPPELFDINPNQENLECVLSENNVNYIEVWVDEKNEINDSYLDKISDDYEIKYEYTPEGEVQNVWVKWKRVDRFTNSMLDERVYTVDMIKGIVRFSDGRNGKIPPSGDEPTIMVNYTRGSGASGNVDVMQINKLNKTIGFIGDVGNYIKTMGGCNQETIEEAVKRTANSLRHGKRAVTATDYENIAMEINRNIIRAKCCSNYNINGEKEYGNVTLVVLYSEFKENAAYFEYIRENVYEKMKPFVNEMLIEQNRFNIIDPKFIVLNVNISLVINDYNKVFEVKENVMKCVEDYLNPISGNFNKKGWNIGECPNENQIQNAIKDIKNIVYIKNVRIDAYMQNNEGRIEIDYDKMKNHPFVLPISGEHTINIDIKGSVK